MTTHIGPRIRGAVRPAAHAPRVPRTRAWASRRSAPMPRVEDQEEREPAPPIKQPTWEWYIPIYFWLGGIAAGAWSAATVEDLAGARDRNVVRAGRYVALGGMLGGTALLIADLGRPERFLNMLRIVRTRSTMSLGSWGLAIFGAYAGSAALLQAIDDDLFGHHPALARYARGWRGRLLHGAGLPWALFVGSYTGTLLGTTSAPSWARRARLLGPLFAASAMSSGVAAIAQVLALFGCAAPALRSRLARMEAIALAAEFPLAIASRRHARALPSARREPRALRAAHALTLAAGMVAPLAMQLVHAVRYVDDGDDAHVSRRHRSRHVEAPHGSMLSLVASGLTLAGGLALRFLTTREGYCSARTPNDTWATTGGEVHAPIESPTPSRTAPVRPRPRAPRTAMRGTIVGRITVVQEDRIRVVDDAGRGYLLTVKKHRASPRDLDRWRDTRVRVRIRYVGAPDAGGRVERIEPLS